MQFHFMCPLEVNLVLKMSRTPVTKEYGEHVLIYKACYSMKCIIFSVIAFCRLIISKSYSVPVDFHPSIYE